MSLRSKFGSSRASVCSVALKVTLNRFSMSNFKVTVSMKIPFFWAPWRNCLQTRFRWGRLQMPTLNKKEAPWYWSQSSRLLLCSTFLWMRHGSSRMNIKSHSEWSRDLKKLRPHPTSFYGSGQVYSKSWHHRVVTPLNGCNNSMTGVNGGEGKMN